MCKREVAASDPRGARFRMHIASPLEDAAGYYTDYLRSHADSSWAFCYILAEFVQILDPFGC